jgi:hypothetical protein
MKKKYERYGAILDTVVHHLKDGRDRDAAASVNALPDAEVRSFAYFCAQHVASDLSFIGFQAREHMSELMARDTPSKN